MADLANKCLEFESTVDEARTKKADGERKADLRLVLLVDQWRRRRQSKTAGMQHFSETMNLQARV